MQDARPHGGGAGACSQGRERRPPWRASTTTTAARWSLAALLSDTLSSLRESPSRRPDGRAPPAARRGRGPVEVNGLARREVRIDLDPDRLRAHAITPAQVARRAARGAFRPAGRLCCRTRRRTPSCASKAAWRPAPVRRHGGGAAQRVCRCARRPGTVVESEREPESVTRVNGQRPSTSTSSSSRTPPLRPPARRSRPRSTSCARPCRPTSSCAWSTPAAISSRARCRACSTR